MNHLVFDHKLIQETWTMYRITFFWTVHGAQLKNQIFLDTLWSSVVAGISSQQHTVEYRCAKKQNSIVRYEISLFIRNVALFIYQHESRNTFIFLYKRYTSNDFVGKIEMFHLFSSPTWSHDLFQLNTRIRSSSRNDYSSTLFPGARFS